MESYNVRVLPPALQFVLAFLAITLPSTLMAANNVDKLETRYSVLSPKAPRSVLIAATKIEDKIVVVGERGHILISKDSGDTWVQAKVPTQSMITAVDFPTPKKGWAVGHEGIILHTSDGGYTWAFQYGDPFIPGAPENDNYDIVNRSGFPLLGVWFKNEKQGIAVGSYGFFLYTNDGGKVWQDWSEKVENEDGWHLNAITSKDDKLVYIVGESGMLFRSEDGGENWVTLNSPYEGSFYGAVVGPGIDDVSIFGLKSNLYKSSDRGVNWHKIPVDSTEGLMGGAQIGEQNIVLGGGGGLLLFSQDGGESYKKWNLISREYLIGIHPISQSSVVMLGHLGVKIMTQQEIINKVSR